jgi:hypothetical protein
MLLKILYSIAFPYRTDGLLDDDDEEDEGKGGEAASSYLSLLDETDHMAGRYCAQ